MKVCGCVIGVVLQQGAKLSRCAYKLTIFDEFHRQAVTREGIRRILRQHRLENF
jgi:hypothetical protein